MRTVVCTALRLSSRRLFQEVSGAPLPSEAESRTEEEVGRVNDPALLPWPRRTGTLHHLGSVQSPQRILASVTLTTLAMSLRKSRVEFPNHMSCDGCGKVVISPKHVSLNSAKRRTNQSDQHDLHLLGKPLLLPWWGKRDHARLRVKWDGGGQLWRMPFPF